MGKTLYLSDLDGTLLTPEQRLSAFTCETVNGLAERGVCFSYATARSGESATIATEGLTVHLPVIIHNGAFIIDSVTQETLYKTVFSEREIEEIMSAFAGAGLCPIVYAVIEGRHRFSYIKELSSRSQWEFVVERYTHKRRREVFDRADIIDGEVFYFACIDEEERMRPVFELLKDKYRCEFARDIYSGEMWLEVMAKNASKAHAALVLKEMLGCDKLVCFGDQTNDLPMFKVADECYAVANAAEKLKAVATGIIDSNREDGVAKYLSSRNLF
ncbi:MAG: HAD family hydrolase [Clostridiales bacterium]|nr:HAD family hydrolase [Clostridiales bacterium]